MAVVDFTERQLTLKLVYFGPPLSGKTSNLRALHAKVDTLNRGRLMTLDTRDDRTLFFDLLPIFFRTSGFSFRIKVYTVLGQPAHEATRKVVLAGADGVVFVADSSPDQIEANRASWQNLTSNLIALGLADLPVVVQYNKRDLPGAARRAGRVDRIDHRRTRWGRGHLRSGRPPARRRRGRRPSVPAGGPRWRAPRRARRQRAERGGRARPDDERARAARPSRACPR